MTPASAETYTDLVKPVLHEQPTAALPDIVVHPEKLIRSANLSYRIAGKSYYPKRTIEEFTQEGIASWYGPGFHGRKTASGERFDQNMLTAAHPTLPIPSYVRVTNLKNSKSVIVRINDRGPFHNNRIIDLSKAAAKKLGFIHAGTARVKIEQLVPNTAIDTKPNLIYVDLQQFDSITDAQQFLQITSQHLQKVDLEQKATVIKKDNSYIVQVGPFHKQERANQIKESILTEI